MPGSEKFGASPPPLAASKSISCRVPQRGLSPPRRHGVSREPRAPSQNVRGAQLFRDYQPRDALLLRYDGEWRANYVPPPFCGARLLFLTFVSSMLVGRTPVKDILAPVLSLALLGKVTLRH
jgi:hypothetical protein